MTGKCVEILRKIVFRPLKALENARGLALKFFVWLRVFYCT